MLDWALATTTPNAERKVSCELAERQLPHYLFKRKLTVANRGKLVERLVPAFPRYIFVPFEICWNVAESFADVIGVVSFGEGPALVRHTVVEKILERCSGDVLVEQAPKSRFEYGDVVFVPELSQSGKFHHSLDEDRCIVLIEWMGRGVFVNVLEGDLLNKQEARERSSSRRRRRRLISQRCAKRSRLLRDQTLH